MSHERHLHKCMHACRCAKPNEVECVKDALNRAVRWADITNDEPLQATADRVFANRWPGRTRRRDLRRGSATEQTYLNVGGDSH